MQRCLIPRGAGTSAIISIRRDCAYSLSILAVSALTKLHTWQILRRAAGMLRSGRDKHTDSTDHALLMNMSGSSYIATGVLLLSLTKYSDSSPGLCYGLRHGKSSGSQ